MKTNVLKNAGIFFAGTALNGYLLNQAIQANNRWNAYLKNLPPEELEKLQAKDWHLTKHGTFWKSGNVVGERVESQSYDAKSAKQKEKILTQYRWAVIRAKEKQAQHSPSFERKKRPGM